MFFAIDLSFMVGLNVSNMETSVKRKSADHLIRVTFQVLLNNDILARFINLFSLVVILFPPLDLDL